jgi:hypothetical protein
MCSQQTNLDWPAEVTLPDTIETSLLEHLFQEYSVGVVSIITDEIAKVVASDYSRKPRMPVPFRNNRPKRRAYLHNQALSRLGYIHD